MIAAIKEHIANDAIAGHEAAIARLTDAMQERYVRYDPKDRIEPCFLPHQGRDMAELSILLDELMHKKGRSLTILMKRTDYGILTEGLGNGLDIGIYHDSKAKAWQHLSHMLKGLPS